MEGSDLDKRNQRADDAGKTMHPAPVAHQSFPGKALELDELAHVVPGVLASRVASSISRISTSADALVARGVKNRVIGIAGSYAWGSQSVRKLVAKFEGKPVEVIAPTAEMKQAMIDSAKDAMAEMASVMAAKL